MTISEKQLLLDAGIVFVRMPVFINVRMVDNQPVSQNYEVYSEQVKDERNAIIYLINEAKNNLVFVYLTDGELIYRIGNENMVRCRIIPMNDYERHERNKKCKESFQKFYNTTTGPQIPPSTKSNENNYKYLLIR